MVAPKVGRADKFNGTPTFRIHLNLIKPLFHLRLLDMRLGAMRLVGYRISHLTRGNRMIAKCVKLIGCWHGNNIGKPSNCQTLKEGGGGGEEYLIRKTSFQRHKTKTRDAVHSHIRAEPTLRWTTYQNFTPWKYVTWNVGLLQWTCD